jgi:Right handed beta helix region
MRLRANQANSMLPVRARGPRFTRLRALFLVSLMAMAGLAVAGITATPAFAAAANIHVEMTGTDDPACGSTADPCGTIGYAYSMRAASGDTITVGPGEFYADDPYGTSVNPSNNLFLYITKTVHFVGAQAGVDGRTRTVGGAGETVIYNRLDGNPSPQLWYVAAPDVTVNGFTFSDVLTGAGHYELVGSGSGGAGVQTRNEAGGVPPPEGTDSDGWTFVNNVFDMTDIGLYVGSVGTVPSLIEHNLFVDNGGVINSNVNSAGIYSDHPTVNTTITENTFAGHVGGTPINIASAYAEPSSKVTISDNKMDGQESVDFYNTADSVITGNSMIGVQRGIALDGGDRGITISDNTISGPFSVDLADSRNCIQLSNTWNVGQNSDVTIFDNVLDHCVTGGISVANTDKVTADYNLITNSGSDGILVIPNTIQPPPARPADRAQDQRACRAHAGRGQGRRSRRGHAAGDDRRDHDP